MLHLARPGKKALYVAPRAILLVALGAVGCEAPEYVPDDFGAADPITLNVGVEVIAEGQNRLGPVAWQGPIPSLIADDSGIYWYDDRGNVLARRRGESEVVELLDGDDLLYERELQEPTRLVMSLTAGADQLYAGEAHAVDAVETFGGAPPSRLLSIPKRGGPATVLLESDSELLTAVGVEGERLIVMGQGAEATLSYYQVDLANPALVPLPPAPARELVRIGGGTFYRADGDVLAGRVSLWDGYAFSACPGYFLARHTAELDTLFLEDAESGHEQMFARIGMRISDPVCDQRHVYFYSSYPAGYVEEDGQLVRVDVESGQLARLSSPDLAQSGVIVLGADDENIYVNDGDRILAVRKP